MLKVFNLACFGMVLALEALESSSGYHGCSSLLGVFMVGFWFDVVSESFEEASGFHNDRCFKCFKFGDPWFLFTN